MSNKINSPVIAKIFKIKTIMLIVSIVMLILAMFFFMVGDVGSVLQSSKSPVHFSEAYNNEELDEGKKVCLYIVEEPYLIGYYDDSECYYYVEDYYDDLYIMRASKEEAEEITEMINDSDYCEVDGVIYELDQEVIDEAINYYNDGNSYPITEQDFEDYFENVALWVKEDDPEPVLIVLGSLLVVGGIILLLICLKGFNSYSTTLRDMTLQTANDANNELADPATLMIPEVNTYFTPKKIISAGPTLEIVNYADIIWVYMQGGKSVTVWDKDYHKHEIGCSSKSFPDKETVYANIIATIQSRNPFVEVGYDVNKMYQYTNLGKNKSGKAVANSPVPGVVYQQVPGQQIQYQQPSQYQQMQYQQPVQGQQAQYQQPVQYQQQVVQQTPSASIAPTDNTLGI